ncbi:hypothetical protein [Mitsuokella jalaludinii]|uniref:hypothetical protein n=1 Tax=Mitsuokella jalaludinii TaxID=187979 RepID=UPI0030791CED
MRTETIITKIYAFDELSDEAKERAFAEARDSVMEVNVDELVDCMKTAMDKMGITINDYGISIDGSGYISLSVEGEDLEGTRAYAYIANNFFEGANKKKVVFKGWKKSRISHLNSKDWIDNCPFSGVIYDFAVKKAWDSWCYDLRNGESPTIGDFLRNLECAYLREVEREYYGFSEGDAREYAEANGYEFLEDGTIY